MGPSTGAWSHDTGQFSRCADILLQDPRCESWIPTLDNKGENCKLNQQYQETRQYALKSICEFSKLDSVFKREYWNWEFKT